MEKIDLLVKNLEELPQNRKSDLIAVDSLHRIITDIKKEDNYKHVFLAVFQACNNFEIQHEFNIKFAAKLKDVKDLMCKKMEQFEENKKEVDFYDVEETIDDTYSDLEEIVMVSNTPVLNGNYEVKHQNPNEPVQTPNSPCIYPPTPYPYEKMTTGEFKKYVQKPFCIPETPPSPIQFSSIDHNITVLERNLMSPIPNIIKKRKIAPIFTSYLDHKKKKDNKLKYETVDITEVVDLSQDKTPIIE